MTQQRLAPSPANPPHIFNGDRPKNSIRIKLGQVAHPSAGLLGDSIGNLGQGLRCPDTDTDRDTCPLPNAIADLVAVVFQIQVGES